MTKTILVTGASSGIGRATAKHFQIQGWNVVATMRAPEKESRLEREAAAEPRGARPGRQRPEVRTAAQPTATSLHVGFRAA